MVCTHRHVKIVTFEELVTAIVILFRYMNKIMDGEHWSIVENSFSSELEWYIIGNHYATIPEHFHIIACDGYGTKEELIQLNQTPRVRFPLEI